MEEKLTFTRVPRSLYWLCCANFTRAKKGFSEIVDHFQASPELGHILERALPTGEGRPSLEAQMAGYGIKGFRDRLAEMYLEKLATGSYPLHIELNRVEAAKDFENRFEAFSTQSDYRLFMLGIYLSMKDLESKTLFGRDTSFIALPTEIDEVLANFQRRSPKIDWILLALNSLLKFIGKEELLLSAEQGSGKLIEKIATLNEKQKMIFLNEMTSYGHAIGEKEFFLYQKV